MARDGSQYLNATVFPGGQLEATDNGDLRRTALRELYEEANIHLQPDPSQPGRVVPHAVKDVASLPYSDYLKSQGRDSAENCLVPLSRWVTPKVMPKRFDSHFFIALCASPDSSVEGRVDAKEIKALTWNSPLEALTRFADGTIVLFPPQWYPFLYNS
jgi:8-oxo-dGTP pyrophosphatase MutT (NUDIX family)